MTSTADSPAELSGRKKPVAEVYVLLSISLLLVVAVGTASQAISLPFGLSVTQIFLILLPAVLYVRRKRLPVAGALRWRAVPAGIAVRSAILGSLGWGMAMLVYLATAWAVEGVIGPDRSAEFLSRALPRSAGQFAVFLVVAAVLPGVCEETLFRGAVQGALEKKGVWKGIVYTAILFAAFHLNPWGFLPAAALGVLNGLLVARTNSTLPAMICHACNNATALTVAFVYRGRSGPEPHLVVGVPAVLFVAALAEFLQRTRGVERRPSPLTAAAGGLSRRLKWIVGAAGAALVVLLAGAFVAFRMFIRTYRMTNDRLAPVINRGDHVIVLRKRYVDVEIRPGDVVAFRWRDHAWMRPVARVDEDGVWVFKWSLQPGGSQLRVKRADIIGKAVYKVAAGTSGYSFDRLDRGAFRPP